MSDLIRIEGLPPLLKKIRSLAELQPVVGAIKAAALHLKGKVAVYPEQKHLTRVSVYGTPFKSNKQRRFFFAALRKGEIEVPYRRGESPGSQTFGRRWTVHTLNRGLTAEVGNNAAYGPLLMDKEKQSRYHAMAGWRTTDDVIADETETVVSFVKYYIDRELER